MLPAYAFLTTYVIFCSTAAKLTNIWLFFHLFFQPLFKIASWIPFIICFFYALIHYSCIPIIQFMPRNPNFICSNEENSVLFHTIFASYTVPPNYDNSLQHQDNFLHTLLYLSLNSFYNNPLPSHISLALHTPVLNCQKL